MVKTDTVPCHVSTLLASIQPYHYAFHGHPPWQTGLDRCTPLVWYHGKGKILGSSKRGVLLLIRFRIIPQHIYNENTDLFDIPKQYQIQPIIWFLLLFIRFLCYDLILYQVIVVVVWVLKHRCRVGLYCKKDVYLQVVNSFGCQVACYRDPRLVVRC